MEGGEPLKLGLSVDDLRHISIHPDGRRIAYCARTSDQPSVMGGLLALENFLPSLNAEK